MSGEDYTLERRTPSVGTPAYQTFDSSFADEGLSEKEEYKRVVEDFQEFYGWKQDSGMLGSLRSAISGSDYIDLSGRFEKQAFEDVFTPVYLADLDGEEDLEGFEGLQNYLGGRDAEKFVSNHDGLAIVSEGGAMLNVQREKGQHWFNWHDSVMDDGEEFAHDVFADYMEHLKNEQYLWRDS